MGKSFASTQIYNSENITKKQFIDKFCKKMAEDGYVTCDSDESELSYILRFADNCKWVTITSEAYEQGNSLSHKDTGRIAKMLETTCVNIAGIDSDCAILELYDKSGKKADMFTIGRADDYFSDDIPQPSEKVWKPFLYDNNTWEQFIEICSSDEVFVEDGLSKLASVIGIDSGNILFSVDYIDESDKRTVFLGFKKTRTAITMSQNGKIVEKAAKKLTINAAFKQIFGEALEPLGFKAIKGRYPYLVRVINNEILHVITFYPADPEYPPDKAIVIVSGVATVYRKKITFDSSPKQNKMWLNYSSKFYSLMTNEPDRDILRQIYKSCYFSNNVESMIEVLKVGVKNIQKYVLPVLDKITDIDSCLDFFGKLMGQCNYLKCTKICTYYPDEDEAFLYFLSDKKISEHPDFLDNYINDSEFHKWILNEIEKRKNENTEILKSYGLI